MTRQAMEIIVSRLTATHATLHAQRTVLDAAITQLGAEILALNAALGEELEGEDESPRCPQCKGREVLPCGLDRTSGRALYVCACGNNFEKEK